MREVLDYVLLDPFDHGVKSFAGQEVGEKEWPVAVNPSAVAFHLCEIRAHTRSKVDLIDHQQIRARNSQPA